MEEDKNLYSQFLNGNDEAFEKLVIKYKNNLIFFINKFVKNLDVAEDIFQDTIIYLLEHSEYYNFNYSFKTYLYTIAKSKSLDFIKHEKIIEKVEKKEFINEKTLEDIVFSKIQLAEIREIINDLPNDYQMVIYLTQIENFSYSETAKIMNKKVEQIKLLVHRARKKIKISLRKSNELDYSTKVELIKKLNFKDVTTENHKIYTIFLIVIVTAIILSGTVYATVKIYETIKSYYQEENVTVPISNAESPVGEIVFKSFNINNNEKILNLKTWDTNNSVNEEEKLYFKKITDYSEYKEMMDNYSELRKLNESDFDNYFAVIVLSKNIRKSLNYMFLTYSDISEEEKMLHINVNFIDNPKNDLQYSGLVLIMTYKHVDYIFNPEIKNNL